MDIREQAAAACRELCEKAGLQKGQILVVGCSSSEICGSKIGSSSNPEMAEAVFSGIYEILQEKGIYLAAQCCEHLNRALIVEQEAVTDEEIRADGGIDIGSTLIGMHLKRVAVPVRLDNNRIGQACVTAARVRSKFIGGERACYDEKMK